MKKLFALILAAALCLGLCACGTAQPAPGQTAPAGDGAEAAPEGPVGTAILTEDTQSGEITARGSDTAVASYTYTYPVMEGDGAAARVFNTAVQLWIADELEDWNEIIDDAAEMLAANPGMEWDASRYVNEITYSTTRAGDLLSIVYNVYSYTAGAHGYTGHEAWLFDLAKGVFVDWSELVVNEEQAEAAVTAELLAQIEAQGLAGGYYPDYADYVDDWDDESVYFGDDGSMTVLFSAYSIAPYAAGEQIFVIAPEVLRPYLTDYAAALLGL